MKKAILFDIDGVLIDSMSVHFASWDAAFSQVGFHPTRSDYHSLGGMPASQTVTWFNRTYNLGLSHEQEQAIVTSKHAFTVLGLQQVPVFDLVPKILDLLVSRNIIISAVTGMPKERAVQLLNHEFPDMFAHIIGYGDYENGKPFADPFLLGWDRTGLDKSECIVVEDSPLGIQSAVSACIDSIGIASSVSREELKKVGATYVVADHAELMELLKKLT